MSIADQYKALVASRRRESLKNVEQKARIVSGSAYLEACKFVTGKDDWSTVHHIQFMRDGTQIVIKSEEGNLNVDSYQAEQSFLPPMISSNLPNLQARKDELVKYESNLIPTVVSGISQSILSTIACTFKDSKFEFTAGDSSSEEAEEFINLHRVAGGFHDTITGADYLSNGVQSSLIHIFPKGDWLSYCTIWPSAVTIVFGEKIFEKSGFGSETTRDVDVIDLEDASAVIICLGTVSTDRSFKNIYLAYVGSCEGNELGRKVTYKATEPWPVPDVGDERIIIETPTSNGGEPCNPMTLADRTQKSIGAGYEYPMTVIKGDAPFCDSEVLPLSDTFARNCTEIEYLWSGIAHNIKRCARGKDVFTVGAATTRLPSSLDVIVCPQAVTYEFIQGNASGLAEAVNSLTTLTRGLASSRGVPPYVVVGPVPWAAESGVSLAIQTAPLLDALDKRIKRNMRQVDKIFFIEKSLLATMNPATVSVLSGVTCTWVPGKYKIPEDRAAFLTNLKTERDLETKDQVDVYREANGFQTDKEAIDDMAKKEERDPEFRGVSKERIEASKPKDQLGDSNNMIGDGDAEL